MKAISIVCDSCGHRAADSPALIITAASSDTAIRPQGVTWQAAPPNACPCCGAKWTRLQAGDEFLIGLTHVASPGRPVAAGKA